MPFLASDFHSHFPRWIMRMQSVSGGVVTEDLRVVRVGVHPLDFQALLQTVHSLVFFSPVINVFGVDIVCTVRVLVLFTVVTVTATIVSG